MHLLRQLLNEAITVGVVHLFAVLLVSWTATRALAPIQLKRLRAVVGLAVLALLFVPLTVLLRRQQLDSAAQSAHVAGHLCATIAVTWALGTLVFGVLTPRLRLRVPRILGDAMVGSAAVVAVGVTFSREGVNLTHLIATSAVLTAVIGLSLQDTLGNLVAGVTLQLDSSVRVGDWVRVGDVNGRVLEVRWRYTALELRNWETVLVPNSQIVKGQVSVIGRREGEPVQWRRAIQFYVDFRYPPQRVMELAVAAIATDRLPNVATTPQPSCVLMELGESTAKYVLRYFLTDPALDDPTDSLVRTRIVYALKRDGVPLAIPAQAVFVTTETAERRDEKSRRQLEQRVRVISEIGLFSSLSEHERARLAEGLRPVPFAQGEIVTRQGATAHWLYVLCHGSASVRIESEGHESEVAVLGPGDFFGEMGLLTGEKRTATIVATSELECYRLGKDDFQELLGARPELAADVAHDLAQRRVQLDKVRERLGVDAAREHESSSAADLLNKIRSFFSLGAGR